MKKTVITLSLSMILLLVAGGLIAQSQFKTMVPDEIHLLQNPFKPMNILINPIAIQGITAQQGDLVMAFDGATCVGAAIIEDVNGILNLVATSTDEVNKGYRSGQTIRLEYHSTYDNTVHELVPEKILLGSMNFEELGTLYAEFKAVALGIGNNNTTDIKVYPNPVSHQLHIVLGNDNIQLSESINLRLINLSGSVIMTKEYNTKQSVINLNVNSLPTGEYTLLLTSKNIKFTQKVIKK